jgi:hypothetical protein
MICGLSKKYSSELPELLNVIADWPALSRGGCMTT